MEPRGRLLPRHRKWRGGSGHRPPRTSLATRAPRPSRTSLATRSRPAAPPQRVGGGRAARCHSSEACGDGGEERNVSGTRVNTKPILLLLKKYHICLKNNKPSILQRERRSTSAPCSTRTFLRSPRAPLRAQQCRGTTS